MFCCGVHKDCLKRLNVAPAVDTMSDSVISGMAVSIRRLTKPRSSGQGYCMIEDWRILTSYVLRSNLKARRS